jgi:hypothetical protein
MIVFELTSDFNVPKTTIHCRIKSGNLEVWQPGQQSMLLHMEVILKAYLFMASNLNCAFSVTESIALVNNLIEGLEIAKQFIIWKKQRGIYSEEAKVLGRRWWSLLKKRNPDVVIRAGQKFKKNSLYLLCILQNVQLN